MNLPNFREMEAGEIYSVDYGEKQVDGVASVHIAVTKQHYKHLAATCQNSLSYLSPSSTRLQTFPF